ncbi:protein tyrosine phosphatase domain-containing protein 1-like [Huso huso]|uniref:Protein tyrosine phosphatase domain-containing protein 1-like n=1 Tax=Huso huso TaxID=61971 RepID=A0ABR0ZF04_HUSHU
MGLHADSSSPAAVEQALSCAVKREGVSNGKGETSCSTGSCRSKQLAVALTLADQHGKNGDTMEKILSWQQELNLSEEAWGKLEKELDPAVLSGLLWGWLEHLKQPVLSEADLTNMQSSLTTDSPLQHLNKGQAETLLCVLDCVAKLKDLPADLEDSLLGRIAFAFTGQRRKDDNVPTVHNEFLKRTLKKLLKERTKI